MLPIDLRIPLGLGNKKAFILEDKAPKFANSLLIVEIGMLMMYPHISFQWQNKHI